MSKLTFALVAALSLATFGCKKKGGAAGEAVAKMEGFQKQMCECKDKACADKVNEEMTKWGTEMAKNAKPGEAEKPDPDLAKKSADIMTKYTECMTKLMMAGAGSDAAKPADGSGSDAAKPADGSGSDAAKPADGSGSAAPAAGSDAKKEEEPAKNEAPAMKKDEPAKADDKKPDDKKAGGW